MAQTHKSTRLAIYAGLVVYALVRERLIFGAEESEEESGSDSGLALIAHVGGFGFVTNILVKKRRGRF